MAHGGSGGNHERADQDLAAATGSKDPSFAEQVREVLDTSTLAPTSLTVEVTETALMNDPEATSTILTALRSVGVKVAIDDFGTGYCSLAYLKRFAVDSLKIDQTFVSEIGMDSENLLAHNILRLADSLAIPAVAEGIEHQAQLDNLALNGCAFGQGFLLARPMKDDDFDAFLSAMSNTEPASSDVALKEWTGSEQTMI